MRETITKVFKKRGMPEKYWGCKNWVEMTEAALKNKVYRDFYLPCKIDTSNDITEILRNIYIVTDRLETYAADYNHLLTFSEEETEMRNTASERACHYLDKITKELCATTSEICDSKDRIVISRINTCMKKMYSSFFDKKQKGGRKKGLGGYS